MVDSSPSLQQKIDSIIEELNKLVAENSRDNTKINNVKNSLRSIGTWHIIDPLKAVLYNPQCSIKIQQKIIELFGKIQDPRVVSVLTSYLEREEKSLRNTAIKSLSLLKNPKVTPYLISATKNEDNG